MPSLSVRAMAEMLKLPAYAQARILTDQEYPKQAPQVFRTPYYQPALTGIRRYFRSNNDKSQLVAAKSKIASLSSKARRLNNNNVISRFANSDLYKRTLTLQTNSPMRAFAAGSVELRLLPDLRALEDGSDMLIFINCRAQVLDAEVATQTAEIAHWVLEQNGINIPISRIQYVDLCTGDIYVSKKRRPATIKALAQNAEIIEKLWPTL